MAVLDVDQLIELTRDDDPKVRIKAAHELCPCQVKADLPVVWDRLIEMVSDPDPRVRRQAGHNVADGSPLYRTPEIVEALETRWNDPDPKVRKRVRAVLNAYRRTGRINIL